MTNALARAFRILTSVYARHLQDVVIEEAKAMGLEVRGEFTARWPVPLRKLRLRYACSGRWARTWSAMSTVPEAIVARHMNMQVVVFPASLTWQRVSRRAIDHSQVMAIGEQVRENFTTLLNRVSGDWLDESVVSSQL